MTPHSLPLQAPATIATPRRWPVGAVRELAAILSRAYLDILLLRDGGLGLLFALDTFLRPQVGCYGLLALLSALAFGTLIGLGRDAWKNGLILANPLLVGLGLGSYLALTLEAALFVAILGAGTLAVTVALEAFLWTNLKLPVLTLPFVLCLGVGYLASLRYGGLLQAPGTALLAVDFLPLPLWMDQFLCALGGTLFVPHPAAGLVFVFALAWRSRILLLLAITGWGVGVGTRVLLTGSMAAVSHPCNYNFILTAMILGGIFLVPSLRSYLIAMIGVVLSAVVLDATETAWSAQMLSAYALPFNVVALGFLYTLGLLADPGLVRLPGRTPEETLQIDLSLRWRFGIDWRTLRLPFFGTWNVWQAFDGPWTHVGNFRYAYDFVITDAEGRTFTGAGRSLRDYYCYRRPVVTPVRGTVVRVVHDLADNEPGQVDTERNWGNLVIIADDRGFFVVVAHLAKGSVRVAEGARVELGTIIGLCGNSGYSPQPHLHVQIQPTAEIGSPTLAFRFSAYLEGNRFISRGLPEPGQNVEPMPYEPALDASLEFLLGDTLTYSVVQDDIEIDELRLKVGVAPDGTLYFDSGRGRLYFGKQDGCFVLYRADGTDPYLSLLLRALPRVPIAVRQGMAWSDSLPASLLLSPPLAALAQVISSVAPEVERLRCELTFPTPGVVKCRGECRWAGITEESGTTFDTGKGPARIRLGNRELIRKTEVRP